MAFPPKKNTKPVPICVILDAVLMYFANAFGMKSCVICAKFRADSALLHPVGAFGKMVSYNCIFSAPYVRDRFFFDICDALRKSDITSYNLTHWRLRNRKNAHMGACQCFSFLFAGVPTSSKWPEYRCVRDIDMSILQDESPVCFGCEMVEEWCFCPRPEARPESGPVSPARAPPSPERASRSPEPSATPTPEKRPPSPTPAAETHPHAKETGEVCKPFRNARA